MSFAEWHRTSVPIDDEGEAPDLGAEILDSSCCLEGFRSSPDCPCAAGEFDHVGDVGRDPFGGAWPMNVND
jgi:hypothetical protein